MSFIRKFDTLIQKSNQNIININLDNDINMKTFTTDFDLLSSKKIFSGAYSFIDVWFDINEDDSIYGVINAEGNSIMHLYINDKIIIKNTLLKYDSSVFSVQFLYIKNINTSTHIIYYLINKSNLKQCILVHYYKENNKWVKNIIDTITFNILTNFVVVFNDSVPTIFYFNAINGYEELFFSTFDLNANTWSEPIQITNSHKFKVYLSAISCFDGSFHITYSENNSNKYYCNYINLYINKDSSELSINKIMSETIACTFPNIIEHNNILYIQWIEFNSLHYCISCDSGKTWTKPILDKNSSEYPFTCYSYKTNKLNNKKYIIPIIFAYGKSFNILGTIIKERIY